MNTESQRLSDSEDWRVWGPYLSERQWGTVREDYSPHGEAWEFVDHEASRKRAYRWGEDGIGGYSDTQQRLCFAVGMWNGKDSIIKERLFGLTGNEGNHGEDVKEHYYYLDGTPSHSYLKMLYKYPQREFPYGDLANTRTVRAANTTMSSNCWTREFSKRTATLMSSSNTSNRQPLTLWFESP